VLAGRLKTADDDPCTAPVRVFAIERFADAEHMRAHEFAIPPDLNLHKVLERGFGPHIGDSETLHEVIVEFTREKALFVSSREWHRTQRLEQTADGALRLTFTCAELAPVVSWILEWGPHARALSPPELVEGVTRELREALQRYGT